MPPPAHVFAVFLGGCAGGLARYAVTRAWSTDAQGIPWEVLAVNLSGAFALALLLVLLERRGPAVLRPLLGPGFLGAWTTFGAIVVSTDQLVAHGHAATGLAYLTTSLGGGVAAAALGRSVGRRC